ncbi:MAG: hypothetical protein JXB49_33250 [Bacteroidales bacterium]|nr:hypothetical protein [Bacteroidales bacterium]
MKGIICLPYRTKEVIYSGNLFWEPNKILDWNTIVKPAIHELEVRGYFASPFPEGDGITFNHEGKNGFGMISDIQTIFRILDIIISDNPASHDLIDRIPVKQSWRINPGDFFYKKCLAIKNQLSDERYITFIGKPLDSNQIYAVTVLSNAIDSIENGAAFQSALRFTSVINREFLISGLVNFDQIPEPPD